MKTLLGILAAGAGVTALLIYLDKKGKLPAGLVPFARFAEGTIQGRFGSTAVSPDSDMGSQDYNPIDVSAIPLRSIPKDLTNIFSAVSAPIVSVAIDLGLYSPSAETIDRIAKAIAYAEGFYVGGSRPARNHNPGDLTVDTIGNATGFDGAYVKYATDGDGWDALRRQILLMLTNRSKVYNRSMTIQQVAYNYTSTDQDAWANNVAVKLGATVNTRLADL